MIQREQLTASEFETLCILMAVGEGATTEELTRALGLCESVTDAVGEAAQTLMERGLLACDECWSVTEQGRKEVSTRPIEEVSLTLPRYPRGQSRRSA